MESKHDINYIRMLPTVVLLTSLGAPFLCESSHVHSPSVLQPDLIKCSSVNLTDLTLNTRRIPVEETACLSLRMFKESGFIKEFNISELILAKFILEVQKGYRQNPYHKWMHGFSVFQFTYAMIKLDPLLKRGHIRPLEGLALIIAAMCHDLDHPGSDNSFQEKINNTIAQKYRKLGSVLERHHIEETFRILNNPQTNFVSHFTESHRHELEKLITQIILATDLSLHLKMMPELKKLKIDINEEPNDQKREQLRHIIISCADLSDQAKEWSVSLESARMIFTEMFTQGDQERLLGLETTRMMDKTQADVPEIERKFLAEIVLPNFQLLESLYPETDVCTKNVNHNLQNWITSVEFFNKLRSYSWDPLDIMKTEYMLNL